MSVEPDGDEAAWAADKRDFIADARDEAADRRDAAADARDAAADAREAITDEREAELKAWEAELAARAKELNRALAEAEAAGNRADARTARTQAREDRVDATQGRHEADVERGLARDERFRLAQPSLLALAFASIAEYLYDAVTSDDVLTRIAEVAVATVAGGDMASVTLLETGSYRTVGSTSQEASAVDQAQYDADQGPCLDAITSPIVNAPAFPDARWPALGPQPIEHGVRSSLSYQLSASRSGSVRSGPGSLSIYASSRAAFDQEAQEIGFILAAHASLAAKAVGERLTLEDAGRHPQNALLSRDVIGQAKGILMERLKTTPEAAFDILRSSSQRLNVKLREVALRLTETGEVDPSRLLQDTVVLPDTHLDP